MRMDVPPEEYLARLEWGKNGGAVRQKPLAQSYGVFPKGEGKRAQDVQVSLVSDKKAKRNLGEDA
jgi:hypothetical protein